MSDRRSMPDIETVRGAIGPSEMGFTLPHEHLMVDFIGAGEASPARYDADAVFAAVLPHLERARTLGVKTLVECTPAYIGRDPLLLRRLSEASGVHILTNTGYYAAAGFKFLPAHTHDESAEQLAARWISEARHGIEGSGIKPGFIKIGVDGGPLPDLSRRIIRAAALAHRETGLVVACHSGNGAAAMEAIDIFAAEGVDADALIWVHAQIEPDSALHLHAAERRAWVEFDGLAPNTLDQHLDLVRRMKDAGRLDRVLLSHDAGWYWVGEPHGGTFRFFGDLMESFLPMLRTAGFMREELELLTIHNPARAFGRRG